MKLGQNNSKHNSRVLNLLEKEKRDYIRIVERFTVAIYQRNSITSTSIYAVIE